MACLEHRLARRRLGRLGAPYDGRRSRLDTHTPWRVELNALDDFDATKGAGLFKTFTDNNTWHVPTLVEALRDPDAGVRRNAAWALGMIGEAAMGPDRSPLASLLFDPDPGVREAAAMAIGLTGDTQAGLELLLERMSEPGTPSDSKRLAAAALGGMEARTAVPVLTKLLADRDPRVRRWAVASLGEIADQQTVAPLSRVLATDPDPGVRVEAVFRLGKFGGEAARPALAAALKDANADVRRLAEAALKELGGGGPS